MTRFATPCFWNCTGIGIAILSIGISVNISRTKSLEFQLAQYKLKTTNVISNVRHVSSELEAVADDVPLKAEVKRALKKELQQSNQILDRADKELDRESDKLQEQYN